MILIPFSSPGVLQARWIEPWGWLAPAHDCFFPSGSCSFPVSMRGSVSCILQVRDAGLLLDTHLELFFATLPIMTSLVAALRYQISETPTRPHCSE